MTQPAAGPDQKSFSPKRRLRRRVVMFSVACGIASLLVGAVVFFVADVYAAIGKAAEANMQTLQRVHCDGKMCDMSDINADWDFAGSDYILDGNTYFVLRAPDSPDADIPG